MSAGNTEGMEPVYWPQSRNADHLVHLYHLTSRLRDRIDLLEYQMTVTQADIDGLTTDLNTYHTVIVQELDNLEQQIGQLANAGGSPIDIDITALRDAVETLPTVPNTGDNPGAVNTNQDTLSTDPTVGDTETVPNDPNADIPVVEPAPIGVDEAPTGS